MCETRFPTFTRRIGVSNVGFSFVIHVVGHLSCRVVEHSIGTGADLDLNSC